MNPPKLRIPIPPADFSIKSVRDYNRKMNKKVIEEELFEYISEEKEEEDELMSIWDS